MSEEPTQESIEAWIQLHRAHRLLLEKVEHALKNKSLPPLAWYDVLLELHREHPRGLRQYELGEKILLNKHNLSRLIDRLEKNRLVIRQRCKEDGRGNKIRITHEGQNLLKKMWPVYSQSIQENFGVLLSSDESSALSAFLKKL